MKIALKDIATIQTGLFAKPQGKGEIVYLQARHFFEDGAITGALYPDLKADKSIQKHLLRDGDILFAAKGTKNFAALYEEQHFKPAVASTTFFVIRIIDEIRAKLDPEYLYWYLNLPDTLAFLKKEATGTSLASISKSVLMELEVPVPPLVIQHHVIKITELRTMEKGLKQQIESLREKQIQHQILTSIF